ncbi:MAG: DUF4097 family beta strand repeat-containing protein [Gemmatimonadales bacterium]
MTGQLLLIALSLARIDPDTAIHLPRNGAVEIDTRTLDITVHIGAGDVVTVRGGDAELAGGTLQIDGNEDDRRVRVLDVTVPAWARLEVSSVNGNLTFSGSPSRLHAETVSGSIRLNGGSGDAELEAVGGPVTVTDFHGTRLSIDATGDSVAVTNATGSIEIDAINGSVAMRGIRSDRVAAASVNGGVAFEGALSPTGHYEFTSQNDDVTLTLPADVSARMRISTMNGGLRTEIPATTTGISARATPGVKGGDKHQETDGERTFIVTFGAGSAQVTVDVYNGNLVVKRQR